MKLKVTVDRIEGNYAVLLIRPDENDNIDWPLKHLPKKVQEGDILSFSIEKDEDETENAKKRVNNLINKLENKPEN